MDRLAVAAGRQVADYNLDKAPLNQLKVGRRRRRAKKVNRAGGEDGGRDGQTSNPVFTTVTIRRAEGRKAIEEGEGQVSIGLGQGQNRYHQVRSGLSCRYVGPSSSRIDLHCGRAAATMSWDTGE